MAMVIRNAGQKVPFRALASFTPGYNARRNPDPDEYLIYAYLEAERGLHIRRTLDQSHYSMLPDTTERDGDQVLLRHLEKGGPQAVVMVDQL
jgi:hypothetical protein